VSGFYLCHAAVEMSTLLAGGISTAALSSLLNLKLGYLLLPFYSFSKHKQKNHVCSHRINTCSTLSPGKKCLASEKQYRKTNNKHVDLSLGKATITCAGRGQAVLSAFRVCSQNSDTVSFYTIQHPVPRRISSPTPGRTLHRRAEGSEGPQ